MRYNFDRRKGQVSTTFFDGARTNICYNCLDRHIEQGRGSQPCFLWEVSMLNGLCIAHLNVPRADGSSAAPSNTRASMTHNLELHCRGPDNFLLVQGNDIGEDRVMTFSDVREEVSRVVRPPLSSDRFHTGRRTACVLPCLCMAALRVGMYPTLNSLCLVGQLAQVCGHWEGRRRGHLHAYGLRASQ